MRLVHGVGFNDKKYPARENGILRKEYRYWSSMMARCYSEPTQKNQKSYTGCEVSENFKSYTYFYEWCQDQIGFGLDGWDLDKDLLVKGNKIYSEDLCVFIPTEINNTLIKREADRGGCPIGVSKTRYGFSSSVMVNNKKRHLGAFNNPHDAFIRYKYEKEKIIRSLAVKYRNQIDPRAYDALMEYKVEITD